MFMTPQLRSKEQKLNIHNTTITVKRQMESKTIFTSIHSEKIWVTLMSQFFSQERISEINHNAPPCIHKVPKTLTETKPEAYTPRLLGLGPYHHLRPELYKMQSIKLAAIKRFLNNEQQQKFHLVVEALTLMEPVLRSCYDQYLDLHSYTLAWIVAIDAVYLLHFLDNDSTTPESDTMVGDVLMLENQIPVILLNEVSKVLEIFPSKSTLFDKFEKFCKKYSPLTLNTEHSMYIFLENHLLHHLYRFIVSDRHFKPQNKTFMSVIEPVKPVLDIAVGLGITEASTVQQHLSFMEKIPWDRILALFGTGDPDEQNKLVEEIDIPSVSQLHKIAKIEFELTNKGGIKGVKFEEAERKFYLPVIKMNINTEIILKNLVAFEAANVNPGSNLVLAEYVDLMCGIVDSAKDVEILRKKGIIEGDLSDEDIACVFNGIRKSTGKGDKVLSNIEKAVDAVNKQYDNIARVKTLRFVKRHVYRSWKFLTVVSTVMMLMLLTVQAFCQVYGCSSRWFR